MKKRKKLTIGMMVIALSIIVAIGYFSAHYNTAKAGFGGGQFDVTEHRDDGNGNVVRSENEPATYLTFNNGKYNGAPVWEQLYNNKFLWYTIGEQDVTKRDNTNTDMYRMDENRASRSNTDYWKLVYPSWNQNLKLGSTDPGYQSKDKYNGDNSGTSLMTQGYGVFDNTQPKHYEWRYLGYAINGQPFENAYFTADYPVETVNDWKPETLNWIDKPWTQGLVTQGPFDRIDSNDPMHDEVFQKKIQWYAKYFFKQNPNLRLSNDLYDDSWYWATHTTLHNNPDESTGTATGWHQTASGRIYYASFVFASPPKPNLRMIDYTVTDKETGRVVGKQTMSDTDNDNIDINYPVTPDYLEAGKTYTINARVKNMNVAGLDGRDTTYEPVRLWQAYKVDNDVTQNQYTFADVENVYPTNDRHTIEYGDSMGFSKMDTNNSVTAADRNSLVSWEFTVPTTAQDEVEFDAGISYQFHLRNQNTYVEDDNASIKFKIKPEDIGCDCSRADLIDAGGNVVTTVIPNQTYGLRLYVKKFKGNKLVGDPNDYYNPFASVDVTLTDKGSVTKQYTRVETTEVLKEEGDYVEVEIPNAITPRTSMIEASWKLNGIHSWMGQSTDLSNDSCPPKLWMSEVNISVNNLEINPTSVMIPRTQSSVSETVTFDFDVNSANDENQIKAIKMVIKKGNSIIWSDTQDVPADEIIHKTVTLSNISVVDGENIYTVEVNPAPRAWVEFKRDGSDPYNDNVASNSIMGHISPTSMRCNLVNNQNTWTTTHYIREWSGYLRNVSGCSRWGCWSYSYCVTTWSQYYTQTISYYEKYQITNVLFRSKLTDDTQGGWIDILNQPGKVKAGYGFDIKYIVKYQTNVYSASPKPWTSGCSGKSVSPVYGAYVSAPTTIQITMPYTDLSGQPVEYNLTPSSSGSWDNLTQTYEMPYHNAFNLGNTRQVFINETARDGNYPLRIDTYPYFYGTYNKPSQSRMLCDSRTVTIQVIGADSDDIKSHITQ